MKYFFFLLLSSALATLHPFAADTLLMGKLTDDRGDALIGASVKVLKGNELVRGGITNFEGVYRLEVAPGVYTVEFSYTGYETRRVTGVNLAAGATTTLDAVLHTAGALQEVVITSYKEPLVRADDMSSGATYGAETIHPAPKPSGAVREERAKKRASGPPADSRVADKEIKMAESGHISEPPGRSAAEKTVGGEPARDIAPAKPASISPEEARSMVFDKDEEKPALKEDAMSDERRGTYAEPAPHAGLLTAGEWNDLHNWSKHWTDLLADGEIGPYEDMYKFYPRRRYAVMLQNEQEYPIVDAEVKLLDRSGNVVWEARTDNVGRAELWADLYSPGASARSQEASAGYRLFAFVEGKKYEFPTAKPFSEGLNHLKINRECRAPKNVDIVWAVDATGSMGDEIEYLKTEVLDVIGRVQHNNPDLSIRMGTVFYRDQGDEYVVKSSGLSPDIRQTVDYIGRQYAGGGGDYPEAVHSALEEAIYRQPWSADAVTRICFLVLDASPHQDPAVIESLQKTIREAARKGIRIVPVSASGIQKDTEFLMKFFGLATNGSYVFLTDHSGIGGKHLEPTTDEYKVELLNDLLVRLITEYSSVETCEGKSAIRFDDPQNQQQQDPNWQAFYYPNPASDQFTLELPCTVQSVTLYDAEGKAVHKLEKPLEGRNTVLVADLPEGFYTIRILKDGRMQSGKIMIVRG
ncbi:MAG: carboxypeptidase regulatory-like domain-containing protein [Saprospiraceae bacterium]